MIQATGIRRTAIAACALLLAGVATVRADDKISASHLQAARATIAAIHITDPFDNILPAAAAQLKATLIQKDPNLESLIVKTVDDQALQLASRRGALEDEVARAFANSFSEDELKKIADFYNSDVGKKLLSDQPIVQREVVKAARIWQNGIERDLAEDVGKVLDKATGSEKAAGSDKAATDQPASK